MNERKMNGLDLFSGIGGIGVGLKEWVRTVAYCERDRYAQSVLLSRMASNDIDRAPIWDDITSLRGSMLPNIDIIFGGFPCQDISVAGRGKGLEGERSGLFYEIIRLTKEIRPTFVFLENVPAIRTRGLREVVRAFTEVGYDCRWTCLSASDVGANHKRERWFFLAYSDSERGRHEQVARGKCKDTSNSINDGEVQSLSNTNCFRELSKQENRQNSFNRISNSGQNVSYAMCEGLQRHRKLSEVAQEKTETLRQSSDEGFARNEDWWTTEPDICRVVNGLQNRVDRIKCLGNSVVPFQVKKAFEKLIGF